MAFAIARGGHLDATVLGALQVDEACNLANWKIPGKKLNGMGGAMDIVSGAKKVIIAMEHCTKNGDAKIVEHCSLPLTAPGCVNTIVTELCIIDCKPGCLTVTAIAPGVTPDEIRAKTGAHLCFAAQLETMLSE
jgi:acetate CoA/acetoacetate CoA-transferase beta subunit